MTTQQILTLLDELEAAPIDYEFLNKWEGRINVEELLDCVDIEEMTKILRSLPALADILRRALKVVEETRAMDLIKYEEAFSKCGAERNLTSNAWRGMRDAILTRNGFTEGV